MTSMPSFAPETPSFEPLHSDQPEELGHGYRFVTDVPGEDESYYYIPAEKFALYFSNRQVPRAQPGHPLASHDEGHKASYREMFEDAELADLVASAATQALGDRPACLRFTAAVDVLSDAVQMLPNGYSPLIFDYPAAAQHATIQRARGCVAQLIDLLPETTDTSAIAERQALFASIAARFIDVFAPDPEQLALEQKNLALALSMNTAKKTSVDSAPVISEAAPVPKRPASGSAFKRLQQIVSGHTLQVEY